MVTALIAKKTQINHASIAAYVTPFNHAFADPAVARVLNPLDAAGRTALDGIVSLQAVIIAYIDDFKFLMILSVVVMPLVLLLRRPAARAPLDPGAVME
jgi:DHA2 family multidrug resistance protein